MNRKLAFLFNDRLLKLTLSGIILCGAVMIALLVTAGMLYI
jgi:hypothetical protein